MGAISAAMVIHAVAGDGGICDLGEAVRAFRPGSLADTAAGPHVTSSPSGGLRPCDVSEPRCWRDGVVADGPGRGDSFLTVLWADGEQGHRRVPAQLARRVATGEPCLPPSAASGTSACQEPECFRYHDACGDPAGGVVRVGRRYATCPELLELGYCGKARIAAVCPESCGRCGPTRRCLSPRGMLGRLQAFARWGWHSQWNQDSVLHLLLVHPGGLLTPPDARFYVEFGYRPLGGLYGPHSNSEYLRRLGWRGVLFDELHHNPPKGLYQETITAENVVGTFERHGVPREPGVVMIDIDSCDLWVFLSLTRAFRPRLVQIEYNRHFRFDDNLTVDCRDGRVPPAGSGLYGASIQALAAAARARGYAVVWVERCFDVFLLRADLVCPGTRLPDLEAFRNFTIHDGGCPDPWGSFAPSAPPGTEPERRLLNLTEGGLAGMQR